MLSIFDAASIRGGTAPKKMLPTLLSFVGISKNNTQLHQRCAGWLADRPLTAQALGDVLLMLASEVSHHEAIFLSYCSDKHVHKSDGGRADDGAVQGKHRGKHLGKHRR